MVVVGATVVVGAWVVVVVRIVVVVGATVLLVGATVVSAAFDPPPHALTNAAPPVRARSRRRDMRACMPAAAAGDALVCSELFAMGVLHMFCAGSPAVGAR